MIRGLYIAGLSGAMLSGCTGKIEDSGEDPDEYLAPLATPYITIVAAIAPGSLKSSCSLGLDLADATSGETTDTALVQPA